MEDVIGLFVPLGAFAMVVLIIWMIHLANKHKVHEQAEVQRHFINKFASGQELTQFLETPQGQNFLKEMTLRNKIGSPKHRILSSVKTGIVLLSLGAGFFALMRFNTDLRHDEGLIYPAVVLSALGIGLLISAVISYWLSKKWDIFEEKDIALEKRADIR